MEECSRKATFSSRSTTVPHPIRSPSNGLPLSRLPASSTRTSSHSARRYTRARCCRALTRRAPRWGTRRGSPSQSGPPQSCQRQPLGERGYRMGQSTASTSSKRYLSRRICWRLRWASSSRAWWALAPRCGPSHPSSTPLPMSSQRPNRSSVQLRRLRACRMHGVSLLSHSSPFLDPTTHAHLTPASRPSHTPVSHAHLTPASHTRISHPPCLTP